VNLRAKLRSNPFENVYWRRRVIVPNAGPCRRARLKLFSFSLFFFLRSHCGAAAVGIVMGLQFAPQLLLLPWTGFAADRFNQRKLLMLTQATMGVLALMLGALTIEGVTRLWHVYVFAFLFGSAAALDAPVRQTFVAELVGDEHLPNAVALNSTSFNAARMIGPALAGLLIAKVGTGWALPDQRNIVRRRADFHVSIPCLRATTERYGQARTRGIHEDST
jgi:MFS family permease